MRQIIFVCLFLIHATFARAEADRSLTLARAGYKDAVKITKISEGGEPRSALIVLTHNGELRMVEGLYNAIDNRRENETAIAKGISEIGIVSDRLIAVSRFGEISFVEPKAYSLNQFAADLFTKGESIKVFFPWGIALASLAASCVPGHDLAVVAMGACAQVSVAGKMYFNREKLAQPRAAALSHVRGMEVGDSQVYEYDIVRAADKRIQDLVLYLDSEKIRLSELRALETACDSLLVPLVKYQYEIYNP